MKSSNNNNSNPYDYVDAVISDIGHSIKHEEEEEKAKANNGGRIADPPNFRPIIKRKYSSGKLSTLEQHDNNNIIDPATISNNNYMNNNKVISTATTFSFDTHPDDESSTFIRAKNSRFILYIRRKMLPLMHRIRNNYNNNGTSINYIISNVQQTKNNKMLVVRKLSLICLILLTFVFLNFGYTASESISNDAALRRSTTTSSLLQTNANTNNSGGGSALQLSFISGYQAKSQVPIPMEYTHFVELGEFVDAVTVIRIHREQTLRQQQQQQQQQQQNDGRRRRLDEDNNKEGEAGEITAEEEEEVDNAIDKAWEEAIHKNPELEQQQQQIAQQQQQEQTNMLMVHHVPFFWHSE